MIYVTGRGVVAGGALIGSGCVSIVFTPVERPTKFELVEETRRFAEAAGFVTHRSLVLDFGVGKGQDPLRALLLSLLGLTPSSEAESRHRAAERLVGEGAVGPERLVFLHDLLDLPQTGEWRTLYDAMNNTARNRGKRELAAGPIARACGGGPMLIIVEDLHWANPAGARASCGVRDGSCDGPGLLVMTSRVEGDPLDTAC